jgi:hypothetical protein
VGARGGANAPSLCRVSARLGVAELGGGRVGVGCGRGGCRSAVAVPLCAHAAGMGDAVATWRRMGGYGGRLETGLRGCSFWVKMGLCGIG